MTETENIDGPERDRLPARDDILDPGSTIDDRYEVLDVLGQGGSAVVYRVYDRRLKQELALKRLHRSASNQSMRLRREVRYAREVRSEHLVRIYDVTADHGLPYITMELVDGETLADRIRRSDPLSVDETIRIAEQVLLALGALHERGIVHRDVKPANILLTRDGNVRLGDLGLARTLAGNESALTCPESMVGTWEYISPEQAIGASIVPESDLYSFGIVLYEMLTGKLPFDCDSAVGFLSAHLTQPPRRLRADRTDLPRWLDNLIGRLLAKRPTDRYRTPEEVRTDLVARRATSAPRRRRILAAAVLLGALVLASSLGYLWWGSRFSELVETSDRKVAAVDRRGRTLWVREDLHPSLTTPFVMKGKTLIATVEKPRNSSKSEMMTLAILDPRTGRRVDQVILPSAAASFPEMPDEFFPGEIHRVDIDHDGNDEIVLDYAHHYWPSFSVGWNPLRGDRAITFIGSGLHRLAGTADLDNDGIDELLYVGVNNRMGWNKALAAVSTDWKGDLFSQQVMNSSPDEVRDLWSLRGLLWYAFVPKDAVITSRPEIVPTQERVLLSRTAGPPFQILFSGFAPYWSSDLSAEERNQMRSDAYERLREGTRFLVSQDHREAVRVFESASRLTRSARDPILELWSETLRLRALIRSGELATANRLIPQLVEAEYASPSDIHWEAATAHHLEGRLTEAFEHYRSGISKGNGDEGRFPREFAAGAVLVLVELGKFDQANQLADAFGRLQHRGGSDAFHLRKYIQWANGGSPEPTDNDPALVHYEYSYWNLEYRRRANEGPESLLRDVIGFLDSSSGMRPMLLSLQADLLHELGRYDEAVAVSTEAIRSMRSESDHNIFVRPHRELIESRHTKITG